MDKLNGYSEAYDMDKMVVETGDDIHFVAKVIGGYKTVAELAKGSYGTVYICQKQQNKFLYAVKQIQLTNDNDDSAREEANIMRRLQHPFVLSSFHLLEQSGELFIFMGLMLCNMETFLEADPLTEPEAMFYAAQLVAAVMYIHSLHIVHRDITLKNIMLSPSHDIRLTDLGLSKVCGDGQSITAALLPDFQYGKTHDWRSTGVCLHKMIRGVFPWDPPVTEGKPISEEAKALLHDLLDSTYLENLNSSDMKHHIFFKTTDWINLINGKIARPVPKFSDKIWDIR